MIKKRLEFPEGSKRREEILAMFKLAGRISVEVLTDLLHLDYAVPFKRRFLNVKNQEYLVRINQM